MENRPHDVRRRYISERNLGERRGPRHAEAPHDLRKSRARLSELEHAPLDAAQPLELGRDRGLAALELWPMGAEESIEVQREKALQRGDGRGEVLVLAEHLDPLVDER